MAACGVQVPGAMGRSSGMAMPSLPGTGLHDGGSGTSPLFLHWRPIQPLLAEGVSSAAQVFAGRQLLLFSSQVRPAEVFVRQVEESG